jgi:hypothetical protein
MRSGTTPRMRKERQLMGRQKDTLLTKADTVRPYVERAMSDENLRRDVIRAFAIARGLYSELARDRDKPITIASRVATDDEIRDKLRNAIEDLRSAGDRLQGKKERSGIRGSTLLVTGIALGILFNPVTGPETRRFIKDMFSGGGRHDHHHDHPHGENGR